MMQEAQWHSCFPVVVTLINYCCTMGDNDSLKLRILVTSEVQERLQIVSFSSGCECVYVKQ